MYNPSVTVRMQRSLVAKPEAKTEAKTKAKVDKSPGQITAAAPVSVETRIQGMWRGISREFCSAARNS